jgi:hypothetical protein
VDVATARKQVEDFLTQTEESRALAERDRDYKDNKQWTAEEREKLEKRGQAAITVNRIKPKVEGLKGLLVQRKTDPKAWPRTQKHEKAAEVITDALRYVADKNDFDDIKLDVAEDVFVPGVGAAIIHIVNKPDGPCIEVVNIQWDRYYYDVHSRRLDFADKRYDGIVIWMDKDQVMETFDISEEEADQLINTEDDGNETFDDRPQWVDRKEQRIRVCQHFYIEKGKWMTCFFSGDTFLIDPMESPYVNEYGIPVNPIESLAANIDRDNNRFGEVRYWIDLQDEINHRRSKYLFLLSQRQTMSRKGAIQDIPAAKRELAKPDGHVEYEGEKGDFDILRTNDMAQAQFSLLQDSKAELDAVGFNAQLSGERQGDLSGKAIVNLQQAATNELSSLYANLTKWEKRVYTQIWWRIKQFWTEEKWLSVTDNVTKLRWVGLNQQITLQNKLKETSRDESIPLEMRLQAQQQLVQMMQAQDPRLQQLVEVRNDVSYLDMDIIIETSSDIVNMQREQFELLAKIAQTRPDVPFTEVIKLSELRGKDEIIDQIEQTAKAQQQAQAEQMQKQEQMVQAELQLKQAEGAAENKNTEMDSVAKEAKARKDHADAEAKELENLIIKQELRALNVGIT